MNPRLSFVATGLALLLSSEGAFAHRLDEYLQAATVTLEKDRVGIDLRLTPGVAVLPLLLALLDPNGDGTISADEQQAYLRLVQSDLALAIDGGHPLQLQIASSEFPKMDAIREGLGEIRINFEAVLPRGASQRTLTFENRHQRSISTYLVNCLVPRDPDLRVTSQNRNYEQSFYQVNYAQSGALLLGWWADGRVVLLLLLVLLIGRLAVYGSSFRCSSATRTN